MSKFVRDSKNIMFTGKLSVTGTPMSTEDAVSLGVLEDGRVVKFDSGAKSSLKSISGDLVDNTDPLNPVISNPDWSQIDDKPSTFTPIIGIESNEAMAGNKVPTSSERGGVLLQTTLTPLSLIGEEDTIDVDSINIIITQINELLSKIQSAGIIS